MTVEKFIEHCGEHYDEVVSKAYSKGVNNFEVTKACRLLETCNLSGVEKQPVFFAN